MPRIACFRTSTGTPMPRATAMTMTIGRAGDATVTPTMTIGPVGALTSAPSAAIRAIPGKAAAGEAGAAAEVGAAAGAAAAAGSLRPPTQDFPRQHHAHHLDRPFSDHEAARIAPHVGDRHLGGEPHAAVDLHATVGHPEAELGAHDLGHVALVPGGDAGIGARGELI